MTYINDSGDVILSQSDGIAKDEQEQRDANGCLPIDPALPYRAICFQPSEEPCVIPNITEQKSRLSDQSVIYKSVELGTLYKIKMQWEYFDGSSYVETSNLDDMTVDSGSNNLPRALFTIYDKEDNIIENIYDSHYVRRVSSIPEGATLPVTTLNAFNCQGKSSPALNGSDYIGLPNEDNIGSAEGSNAPPYVRDQYPSGGSVGGRLIRSFTKKNTSFFIPVDGVNTVTEISDPSNVRTGPTQTIGYIGLSERNNNSGNFETINKQIRYNYVTSLWEDI